jgi:hypothetical protein
MGPSPMALAGRNGDAQCLAASVSESGHGGRWSVECLEGDERLPVSLHRQTTHAVANKPSNPPKRLTSLKSLASLSELADITEG